jgi:hypothetical protein
MELVKDLLHYVKDDGVQRCAGLEERKKLRQQSSLRVFSPPDPGGWGGTGGRMCRPCATFPATRELGAECAAPVPPFQQRERSR